MEDWTRSEIIGFMTLLATFVACIIGIIAIKIKIVRTLLLFITVMLLITTGLLLSKNFKKDDISDNKNDNTTEVLTKENEALKKRIFELESNKSQNSSPPTSTPNNSDERPKAIKYLEMHDISFEILSCKYIGNSIQIEMMITNLKGTKKISVYNSTYIQFGGEKYRITQGIFRDEEFVFDEGLRKVFIFNNTGETDSVDLLNIKLSYDKSVVFKDIKVSY